MTHSIDAILKKIEARRSFFSTTLSLQEQSKALIKDKLIWKILLSVSEGDINRMGLNLAVKLNGEEIENSLISGNVIGSARLVSEPGTISVIIEPKVPAERLVSIIEFVQRDYFSFKEISESYSGASDILTLQILRCLRLIARTLSLGSIRGYRSKSDDLPYVKGRIDFSKIPYSDWTTGRRKVRCHYSELTVDTPRNRVFRLALVKSSKVLTERGQKELFNSVRMVLYSLDSVLDQPISTNEIQKVIRDNPRDIAALKACQDIIFNLSISPHPSRARSFFSYSINMAHLFEDYCHRLVSSALAEDNLAVRKDLIFPIEGISQTIRLDGLYGEGERQVLIECKYKSISSISDVNRTDIYQCIAYCCHAAVKPRVAVMLYPKIESGNAVSILGSIGGFNIVSQKIYVIAIDLCCTPSDVVNGLKAVFKGLLAK